MTMLNRREGEGDGAGIAAGGEAVDPGTTGITEAEKFGYFVEGFSGGVVDGATHVAVVPGGLEAFLFGLLMGKVEVCVASGNDEGEEGGTVRFSAESCRVIHQDGVDVAFQMVDRDQGFAEAERKGFGIGDAHQQGSGEPGTAGDGDGVDAPERDAGLLLGGLSNGCTHHGYDVAEVLAAGELGDDAAIVGV